MLGDKYVERIFFVGGKKGGGARAEGGGGGEGEEERKTKSEALYIICVFHSYYWCGFKI